MSNKYQSGKIYKVTDIGYNKCYYGSTTRELSQRMADHRNKYRGKSDKQYKCRVCVLFDEYGIENCKIELVELFPCNSKSELTARECHYIKNNECLNKVVPGRTRSERYVDNRDSMLAKARDKYENNKVQVLQKAKQYYEDNRDQKLSYQKDYNQMHREQRVEYQKQYRETNKQRLLDKKAEKITCPVCGVCCRRGEQARHNRSQRHQQKLQEQGMTTV